METCDICLGELNSINKAAHCVRCNKNSYHRSCRSRIDVCPNCQFTRPEMTKEEIHGAISDLHGYTINADIVKKYIYWKLYGDYFPEELINAESRETYLLNMKNAY